MLHGKDGFKEGFEGNADCLNGPQACCKEELEIKKVIRNGIENKNSNIVMLLYTSTWKTMHSLLPPS